MTLTRRAALSRRGFCLCCLSATATAAGGGLLAPRKSVAELLGIVELINYEAARTPIAIHRLRDNVAVLEGSGGNVAVLTGPDGKLVVDSGIAVSRPQMETALSALGPQPVTHLINTHWHFDHANGNEWLHELGPEIIAHQNTPRHLATTQRVEDWSTDFRPLSKAALPTVLFDESVSTEVLVALPLFLLVTLLVLPFAKGAVIGFAWARGVTRDPPSAGEGST
jgi:hypothetical protein